MLHTLRRNAMHLVRYHVAISLDGFIAPGDGSADWLQPYGKVAMGFIGPWMKQIGGIIVGRSTYDQSLGMGGWMWGQTPALVMTSRPIEAGPQTVHAHAGDPAEGLAKLRRRMSEQDLETDIWLFGGGVTAGLFLKQNLIDLVELAVVPIVLRKGRPLFAGAETQLTFEHTSSQPIGMGVIVNSYRRMEAPIRRRAGRRS
jgi:dihydrofolate reductase